MAGMQIRGFVLALSCAALAACGAVPSSAPRSPQSAPRPVAVSPTAQTCLAELNRTGSRFSPLPDRYEGQGCAFTGAVQLSAVRADTSNLGVGNIGPVECETARVFLGWARFGVDRAARQILGSPIARIETMPQCGGYFTPFCPRDRSSNRHRCVRSRGWPHDQRQKRLV